MNSPTTNGRESNPCCHRSAPEPLTRSTLSAFKGSMPRPYLPTNGTRPIRRDTDDSKPRLRLTERWCSTHQASPEVSAMTCAASPKSMRSPHTSCTSRFRPGSIASAGWQIVCSRLASMSATQTSPMWRRSSSHQLMTSGQSSTTRRSPVTRGSRRTLAPPLGNGRSFRCHWYFW